MFLPSLQEIPFQHIWSGNQNNLHCSFSLELVEGSSPSVSCKIQVYQKAILSNRQVLNIQNNFSKEVWRQWRPLGLYKAYTPYSLPLTLSVPKLIFLSAYDQPGELFLSFFISSSQKSLNWYPVHFSLNSIFFLWRQHSRELSTFIENQQNL